MPADSAAPAETVEAGGDPIAWLRDFEARHGRPMRVLHVGNIANNAYLNAKFLRRVGVEAHVLSYDYDHVMATPEWEEVELRDDHGDDFNPVFSKRDLQGYERPAWFVSGPLLTCSARIAELWGQRPSRRQRVMPALVESLSRVVTRAFGPTAGRAIGLLFLDPRLFCRVLWKRAELRFGSENRVLGALARAAARLDGRLGGRLFGRSSDRRIETMVALFDRVFPDRPDRLTASDVGPYHSVSPHFRAMFRHYDIVQCYATEPAHALLADKRPYVAFEHGTLRDFTLGDAPLHRMTALGYRTADHTFITNGDCLAYAKRLGIEAFSPMIHPIDTEQHRQDFGDEVTALRREIGGEVVLFCPLRHDWAVKGTDVHLRALPLIKRRIGKQVRLVLIRWGAQLADSRALLESLGCADDVVWRPSLCRIAMIKHLQAADVVLDQMALPHFGATAPQAIAAGTPVISCYRPESTAWIVPEPAPILPAFSPEEVATAVEQALVPGWRLDYQRRARVWTELYHSPDTTIREHLRVYREALTHERQGDRAQRHL